MKISFDKIGSTAKSFEVVKDDIAFSGSLKKVSNHAVDLNAKIDGFLELQCDRCGSDFDKHLNYDIALQLSDEIVKDKEDLDIIEFLDSMIDIDYLFESEIDLIKSSYNYCPKCESLDEGLEIEL